MPTITTDTSFTLAAGKAAVFSPSGSGWVLADPGGRAQRSRVGGQVVAVGPWSTDVIVQVTVVSGSINYTVDDDGHVGANPVVVSTDDPVDADGRPDGTIYIQVA